MVRAGSQSTKRTNASSVPASSCVGTRCNGPSPETSVNGMSSSDSNRGGRTGGGDPVPVPPSVPTRIYN